MSLIKSIMDLFSEIWKWARIVSRHSPKSLIGEVEKLRLQRKCLPEIEEPCKEDEKKEVVTKVAAPVAPTAPPQDPVGEELQLAEKIVKDVIDDIDFTKKCENQKDSWLTFSNMPNNPSIRYYVLKNVHVRTGIIPRWIKTNEITFTLA